MLFGRSTYELFARSYGQGGGNPVYAARFNAMRKYVFSAKLDQAEWTNTTIVRGDVVEEISRLKQQSGANLVILGHGRLSETLLRNRLLDVIELSIYPELLGRGKPFLRAGQAAKLKLTATKSFANNVKLVYEPQY